MGWKVGDEVILEEWLDKETVGVMEKVSSSNCLSLWLGVVPLVPFCEIR